VPLLLMCSPVHNSEVEAFNHNSQKTLSAMMLHSSLYTVRSEQQLCSYLDHFYCVPQLLLGL